ncbi:MAG: hypothetical protein WAL56_09055 [Candidatus Sulfotelmatobacter sp.]
MKRVISARSFACPVIRLRLAHRSFSKVILVLLNASLIAGLAACGGSSKSSKPAPLPDGNYVYSVAGLGKGDVAGNNIAHPLYFVAGVFTVSGGVISAGEQDITDAATNDFDQINPTGSSIAITSDGNFEITLNTCEGTACTSADPRVGVSGVETLDCSFLGTGFTKAYIAEYDANFTGSGTLELQSAASTTPSGGYAFNLYGLDKPGNPVSIGGVLKIDVTPAGVIPGTGSIFDLNDSGLPNYIFQLQNLAASSVSAPDSFGRLTFTLNPDPSTGFSPIILVGYNADADHIRLVETNDSYDGTLGGVALSQGTNAQNFSSSSISGSSYVVGLTGFEKANNGSPLQVAGVFAFNSDGTVTGFLNHNDGTVTGVQAPITVSGTYTVDAEGVGPDGGTGRVTLSIPGPITIQLYLDGSGHALAITEDSTDTLGGLAFQQSGSSFSTSSFNGSTVLSATGWDKNKAGEFDGVGPIAESGSAGTFSGTADLNWLNSAGPTYPDLSVSGTVTTTNGAAANGVFTGTITGLDLVTKTNSDAFTFYLIDSSGDFLAIETDPNQLTLGYFSQQ